MSARKRGGRKGAGRKGGASKTKAEEQADRLLAAGEQLAATGRKLNRDPRLLAIIQGLRKVLPGDERVADAKALGAGQPRALGKVMSDLTSERPGVLGETGLGALQVWKAVSEALGLQGVMQDDGMFKLTLPRPELGTALDGRPLPAGCRGKR